MGADLNNGCVLLIDDEQAMLESLAEFLTECGFRVHTAGSVDSAMKLLDGQALIEAIISDLRMPGKTGIDLIHHLNINNRKIPLIFLTGYGALDTCQAAVRAGAFDYILKPIDDRDKVLLPLRHAVEKFRLEKHNDEIKRELEVFYKASTKREERIVELKKEINVLCQELGRPSPYSGGQA